ncbi:MAG TPA: APC family permease [Vicinamibacterales bacterium]|nr:APC family permease [Vicinamibacterales bacterium]
MAHSPSAIPKTLGLADLVLLGTVAIVNVNVVPPVSGFGRATLLLWLIAWLAFFVPEAIAVLVLSKRYPGEGGVYLWCREHFGDLHGFIAGWCYWTNSLFYVPVLLVYIAGVAAYAGGDRWVGLVDDKVFVATVAFGWLAFITIANIRGLSVGKWINNIGGAGGVVTVGLVALAAAVARANGTAVSPPPVTGTLADMAGGLGVMCFAFIGIELASTMADEIRNPERDVPRSVVIAGLISLAAYLLVADALLALVPAGELGAIQGVMQAVHQGAAAAGASWLVTPIALVMAIAIGGSASAWFAGPARIPFVAGLNHALPAALGRVHPRWGSPYVALIWCAIVSAALTALSLAGSSVAEAYQVLLRAAVVINLVPFVYAFLALLTLGGATGLQRLAGAVGAAVTTAGMVAVFLPTGDVGDVWIFELKMAAGVGVPILVGLWLYGRSRSRPGVRPA